MESNGTFDVDAIGLVTIPERSTQSTQTKLETSDPESAKDEPGPPSTAVGVLQRWNSPRINMWRVFACFWSLFVMGMNDGSYGALVPYLEKFYDLNYTIVSLVFLSPSAGYTLAALVNSTVHVRFGQRGIAVVGPLCHLISYIVLTVHPPYPALVVIFIIAGFGNGLIGAAWCAWIGNMANANEVTGFLQACYTLGATLAPLMSTTMFTKGGLPWYAFYYIMVSIATVELISSSCAFWKQTAEVYLLESLVDSNRKGGGTREAIRNNVTWIFAIFIFGYVGAEVSIGGWIVTFMTKVRSASSFASGVTATGFWGGQTAGRIGLSFLTAKLGEFRSVLLYLGICLGLELILWFVPSLVVSAVGVALLGVFMGPLFPTAIIVVTRVLPRHLHVSSIGFGTALGGSGGAVVPFIVGTIAQAEGVGTLPPIVLAILAIISGLWLLLWRSAWSNKKEKEESRESVTND